MAMQRRRARLSARSVADDARAAAGAALSGAPRADRVLPRVAATACGAVPGVAAVGLNSGLHPLGNMWTPAEVVGRAAEHRPGGGAPDQRAITRTRSDIRLAAGRLLDRERRRARAQPVALVNERFVRDAVERPSAARPDRPAAAPEAAAVLGPERRVPDRRRRARHAERRDSTRPDHAGDLLPFTVARRVESARRPYARPIRRRSRARSSARSTRSIASSRCTEVKTLDALLRDERVRDAAIQPRSCCRSSPRSGCAGASSASTA